jgi:hypothetical protein
MLRQGAQARETGNRVYAFSRRLGCGDRGAGDIEAVAGLLLHRPATPRRAAIPAAHVARIRTWVKYGITVPQVAAIYGVEVDEIARILGNADGKLFNLWRGSRMGHSMRVALPELSAPRSQGSIWASRSTMP